MAAARWTDEMLDKVAEKIDRIADEIEQTSNNVNRIANEIEQTSNNVNRIANDIEQTNNNVDALVGAVNSLVTVLREEMATIKPGQQETAKIQAESIRELIRFLNKSNPE
jgi:methyl-accepting chemotaxis protein